MIEISDHLFRGPRPSSYADLQVHGFDRVIDLQSGAENFFTDTPLEHQNPNDYGIRRVVIQCSNMFPPDRKEVAYFLRAMTFNYKKTYVHCHSGVDRTGFMCAIYRMHIHGWSFEKAHDEFVKSGRHWWFWWWKYELKKWEI